MSLKSRAQRLAAPGRRLLPVLVLAAGLAQPSLGQANPAGKAAAAQQGLSLLRSQGSQWVDAWGRPVVLKGTNLGNWLVQEFWMMELGAPGVVDQCTLEAKLSERFGRAEKERLIALFRDNWMKERDWDLLADFGFNLVRLPILWSVIEDETRPGSLRSDAWKYLDWAIAQARQRGMYVILDLHGAVGGQTPNDHTGCAGQNQYWSRSDYQARTRWLWQQIAARYKDEPVVAAYDPLNEPWGSTPQDMATRVIELYHAIREVDPRHIVLLPSHYGSIEAYGDPASRGLRNVAFELHPYPGLFGDRPEDPAYDVHRDWLRCGPQGQGGICEWSRKVRALKTPLLMGEFQPWQGAGLELGGKLGRATYDAYAAQGFAATSWAYKIVSARGGHGEGTWGLVSNAAVGTQAGQGEAGHKLDYNTASLAEIEALFNRFGSQALEPHPGLLRQLRGPASTLFTLPARPTGLTLSQGPEGVRLRWRAHARTEAGADFSGYKVYRSSQPADTSRRTVLLAEGLRTPAYLDTTAQAGQRYYYTVTASDAEDESYRSDELSVGAPVPTLPVRLKGEDLSAMSGIRLADSADEGVGRYASHFETGRFIEFKVTVATSGDFLIDYRLASESGSPGFELWLGERRLDRFAVPATGGWQQWSSFSRPAVRLPAGTHSLRLKSRGPGWNLNYIELRLARPG